MPSLGLPLSLSQTLTSSRKLFMISPSLSLRTSLLEQLSQLHFSQSHWCCSGPALVPGPQHSQAAGSWISLQLCSILLSAIHPPGACLSLRRGFVKLM